MACHTWYYKRVERTQQQANANYLRHQRVWLRRMRWIGIQHLAYVQIWQRLRRWVGLPAAHRRFRDNVHRINVQYSYLYPFESFAELQNSIAIVRRQIRMVRKGLCQKAVWNHQKSSRTNTYVGGIYFEAADGYHDGFRVYDFKITKEVYLYSYAAVVAFLETLPEQKKWVGEDSMAFVQQFFEQYPDGMICFG
jgi:hypothetical protein